VFKLISSSYLIFIFSLGVWSEWLQYTKKCSIQINKKYVFFDGAYIEYFNEHADFYYNGMMTNANPDFLNSYFYFVLISGNDMFLLNKNNKQIKKIVGENEIPLIVRITRNYREWKEDKF
jgi:maltose-binding protein MalE